MPSIYRKAAKGQAEIETRANKLAPRLRAALIMVDGKRSETELRPLLMPTPDETLAALLAQGYIEVVDLALASAATLPITTPAAGDPPLAMKPMPVPLPVRRREGVRLLTDQVGPMAEAVALRMERAQSVDELRAAVLLGAQIIANTRGRQAAEAYVARFADL